MTTPIKRMYHQGYVTSRDRADLGNGEMQQATGAYYKPGNKTDIFKLGGRSTFGDTSTAAKVSGLAVAQFDSGGTDYVLARSGTALYGATPGASGTFSSLYTMVGTGTTLDYAHANDRYYLALGSENQVLESDGTLHAMGMQPPAAALTKEVQVAGTLSVQASSKDDGWVDMAKAYDGDADTSSYATSTEAGTVAGVWGFSSDTTGSRQLQVVWSLEYGGNWASYFEDNNTSGAEVTVKIEVSEDSGSTYTTVWTETVSSVANRKTASIAVSDAPNLTAVKVRASLITTARVEPRIFRVYSITIIDGGTTDTFSASELTYAYAEYDNLTGTESVPSDAVKTGSFTDKAAVKLTLPATATNSRTTHLVIYRTPDNGSLQQMGRIGTLPIGQTTFYDTFSEWGVSEQPVPTVAYVEYEADGQKIRTPRNFPPPQLRRVFYYRGGLVGLSDSNPRGVYYSLPGLPEAWPREYFLDAIPLEEHDELIDGAEIGGSAILAARGAMIRVDEFPRSVAGVFVASEAVAIKGAPGCVGAEAFVPVNYRGQSHAAWLSPEDGLLVTDGHQWDSIGDENIDWAVWDGFDKSGWVLTYYKHLRVIRMDYSSTSGGTNDRFLLFHIDKSHTKEGRGAKVTGPHYGAAAKVVASQVGNTTRIYSAHTTDGKVYLDHNNATGADSSNAYDTSGTHPLIVKGGRHYEAGWRAFTALGARLYHGDFGTGQTLTVAYSTGRDSGDVSQTRSQSVSLAGHVGTQFDIARSGEWHEETLTHNGTGISHIGSLTIRARIQGDEGKQAVG